MERRVTESGGQSDPVTDSRARLIDLAKQYRDETLEREFFREPVPVTVVATPNGHAFGVRVTRLTFASGYQPFLAEYRAEHHRWVENHTVHAQHYGTGTRPTVVCLHGWGGGKWWLEERAFVIGYWLARGFDVVLFQLPFHGERAPSAPGTTPGRFGTLFLSANLVRTNEAFGQAIHDLRALRTHLMQAGAPSVGVMGMSLGGYTAALWATIDPELAFAVAMIPAVSMSDLMWRHGETSHLRRRAAKAGVSEDLLNDVFAVHAPTTRPPLVARDRLMIVAGRADCITPPDQAERLWRHWGQCAIHWFPGGHLAQVGRGDAFRAVRRHLQDAGFPQRRLKRNSDVRTAVPR